MTRLFFGCVMRLRHLRSLPVQACGFAAELGHLEVLQRLRANGCPWDEDAVTNAASEGHLEVVRWAVEHGCPWNGGGVLHASWNDHADVVQWLTGVDI